MHPRIFPTVMIVLSILAAFSYALQGDIRKTLYWASSALLNISVTY